jgi:hypothetical protein
MVDQSQHHGLVSRSRDCKLPRLRRVEIKMLPFKPRYEASPPHPAIRACSLVDSVLKRGDDRRHADYPTPMVCAVFCRCPASTVRHKFQEVMGGEAI